MVMDSHIFAKRIFILFGIFFCKERKDAYILHDKREQKKGLLKCVFYSDLSSLLKLK